MKKLICIILALTALMALTACDGEEPDAAEAKYVFVANGVEIRIDAPADTVLPALGEPKSYDESPSCAFEGLDKVYVYAGFKIQTYPLNGKDYIYSVSLTDDSVATPESVAVGAGKDQVTAAYGTPTTQSDTEMVYRDTQSKMHLQFLLRDGKVTNIQYAKQTDTQ